ncbi:uncharacterized protein LOC136024666 [Artemia franciscana]|uniref:uncharacterized protein LOC136024666 n=1 Tax=Artemia franciscana TaxID=6661 RepID=UPI0032DA4C09
MYVRFTSILLVMYIKCSTAKDDKGLDAVGESDEYEKYYGRNSYVPGCCRKSNQFLSILGSTALLFAQSITKALAAASRENITMVTSFTSDTTDKMSSVKKRTHVNIPKGETAYDKVEKVILDGTTLLNMMHHVWLFDVQFEDPSCSYYQLCKMNKYATESRSEASWAVHLSSIPLSYLLHHRRGSGFSGYLNASIEGQHGANCSTLFNRCIKMKTVAPRAI